MAKRIAKRVKLKESLVPLSASKVVRNSRHRLSPQVLIFYRKAARLLLTDMKPKEVADALGTSTHKIYKLGRNKEFMQVLSEMETFYYQRVDHKMAQLYEESVDKLRQLVGSKKAGVSLRAIERVVQMRALKMIRRTVKSEEELEDDITPNEAKEAKSLLRSIRRRKVTNVVDMPEYSKPSQQPTQ